MTDLGNWSATVGATVRVELRRWSRRKTAVVSAFLLPVAMAVLICVALSDAVGDFSTSFAVVDLDRGPAATEFFDEALGGRVLRDVVDVRHVATETEARHLVDDGDVGAALILPDRMTEDLAAGHAADIDVLRSPDDPIAGDLAALVAEEFQVRALATTLAVRRTGSEPPGPWPLELTVSAPDGGRLDAPTHYGPAIGLFFVLVTMGFAASRLVADRQRGVVERLAAAPVAPSAVLTGRAVAGLVVGGISMVTMAVVMQVVFGRSWGPLVPVAVVTAAALVALTGVSAVLAAVARTPEQAQTVAGGVAFVFALASGSFALPGVGAPRTVLARLVPTTHALDAFAVLTTEHGGVSTVLVEVGVLLVFGALGLLVAPMLVRRIA